MIHLIIVYYSVQNDSSLTLFESIPRPLFTSKFLQHFLSALLFFFFKFSVRILLSSLILPVSRLDVERDIIHRVFNQ